MERLNRKKLTHLILCEPFTTKGYNRIQGLSIEDKLTKEFAIQNGLIINGAGKYGQALGEEIDRELVEINAGYTTTAEQKKRHEESFQALDFQFESQRLSDAVITFTAVVGNGKSVEIYRRFYDAEQRNQNKHASIILDLEKSKTYVKRGVQYNCPYRSSSLWLFCTTLLKGLVEFIEVNKAKCVEIATRFLSTEKLYLNTTNEQKKVFEEIKDLNSGWPQSASTVFSAILTLLKSSRPVENDPDVAKADIEALLELLAIIMYCQDPTCLHYIIIDNLEQYIKLTEEKRIQILDKDIKTLYEAFRNSNNNVFETLSEVSPLQQCPIKIIFAIRRTSKRMLGLNSLTGDEFKENTFHDITGHAHIYDIWEQKYKKIWEDRQGSLKLSVKYDTFSSEIVNILNWMMEDCPNDRVGGSYQVLIAGLMSQGLRRIAKAEAETAFRMHEYIASLDFTIDKDLFWALNDKPNATRYLFRRALVECQLRRFIAPREGTRWPKMNIGHVCPETDSIKLHNGRIIARQKAKYFESGSTTLSWRILTTLSRHYGLHEETAYAAYPVEVFDSVSLIDLMFTVLLAPQEQEDPSKVDISKKPVKSFARTIYALGNMSFRETEGAPFIIVMFKDPIDNEDKLSAALQSMWNSKYNETDGSDTCEPADFCVRITEAGYNFVYDWLPSYSYMAALKCYSIPPLVLLKDIKLVQTVLDDVFSGAKEMCTNAIEETDAFLHVRGGENKLSDYGLLEGSNESDKISFLQRTKSLHEEHLRLYKSFVIENGESVFGSSRARDIILDKINEKISAYKLLGTIKIDGKDVPRQCF